MDDIEVPVGFGDVGNLWDAYMCLDITSCGNATIWEYDDTRYIRVSQGCPPKKRARLNRKHERELKQLAEKLGITTKELKQNQNVDLPELHSCQTGVLSLGTHSSNHPGMKGAADERPQWIIQAEERLTRYPYSLLFSFLRLVKESRLGGTLDDCMPPDKVLEWCSMYGLPEREESYGDDRYGCLMLQRFQWETVILYLLFHLWKSLIEWQLFDKEGGSRYPEDAERHRNAIHHYADLLFRIPQKSNPPLLAWHIDREQLFKQQLDYGILDYVEPGTKTKLPLKNKYQEAKKEVDFLVRDFIDEVNRKHLPMALVPCSAASKILMKARSVFDGCYLQLAQLMTKSPEESTQHLKLCEVPSCGRLFWHPTFTPNIARSIQKRLCGLRKKERN